MLSSLSCSFSIRTMLKNGTIIAKLRVSKKDKIKNNMINIENIFFSFQEYTRSAQNNCLISSLNT